MLWIRRKHKNLLLLVFTLILCFFVFEVFLRAIYPTQYNVEREYMLSDYGVFTKVPNLEFTQSKSEYTQLIKLNSRGLRDYEYDYEKKNSYRIVMVGDSFVEAKQVELKDTVPKILETKLEDGYEVINFGFSGFGFLPEAVLIEEEVMKYDPDLIILNYFVGNDLTKIDFGAYNIFPDEFWTEKHDDLKEEVYFTDNYLKLKNFLRRNSMTYYLVRSIVRSQENNDEETVVGIRSIFDKEYDENMNKKLDTTKLIFKFLKELTSENDVDFVVVVVPTKEQVDLDIFNNILKENKKSIEYYELDKMQRIMKDIFDSLDIEYIDLLPELREMNEDNDFYWEIDIHFNKKGYEVVANLIYDELVNKKLIKP